MDLFDRCRNFTRATEVIEAGIYPYFKAIQSGADSEVMIDGEKKIMIGSNNYLGLTFEPECVEAAREAVAEQGTGTTGSRMANGTYAGHVALEKELAAFLGRSHSLVFTTGFLATMGAVSRVGAMLGC